MTVDVTTYSRAHMIIAAATRLRDAWVQDILDVVEMHDAALGLISATETRDLQSALDMLHECGHGATSD